MPTAIATIYNTWQPNKPSNWALPPLLLCANEQTGPPASRCCDINQYILYYIEENFQGRIFHKFCGLRATCKSFSPRNLGMCHTHLCVWHLYNCFSILWNFSPWNAHFTSIHKSFLPWKFAALNTIAHPLTDWLWAKSNNGEIYRSSCIPEAESIYRAGFHRGVRDRAGGGYPEELLTSLYYWTTKEKDGNCK